MGSDEKRNDITDELPCWLALGRAPGLGPATVRGLIELFGSAESVIRARRSELAGFGLPDATVAWLCNPDWDLVEADLRWCESADHHILRVSDPGYPRLLLEIANPPTLLFVVGDPDTLCTPQLAIVGSRNPTQGGRANAFEFASTLSHVGLTITSGLALGIDAAGHRGALDARGRSIAVLGTGADRVYPARHKALAHEIAACGALVSEFHPGTQPMRQNFPRRNRLIAGLSLGTLVVEAALSSGSLITARYAAEQGREVFAIPGSIHNPLAKGCHVLIREGAKLVESAQHVLEELPVLPCSHVPTSAPAVTGEQAPPADPQHAALLESIGYDAVNLDTLVERTRLTPAQVSSMLLIMELEGRVIAIAGGKYMRAEQESRP